MELHWTPLVPAQPLEAPMTALWVKVLDYVRGPARLRVEATGTWNYDAQRACGPDGATVEGFEDGNLLKTALRGCLIAKIGGSCGDTPADGSVRPVGSFSIFEIPAGISGPLFLGMNDSPKRFPVHGGSLTVTISEAP